MNLNVIGGTLGILALVALFFFHGRHETPVIKVPTPVVVTAPVVAPPVVKVPIPEPVPVPIVKPVAKPVILLHRVEQGGVQGPETTCTSVKLFADGKTPAELAATAKQYGVSVDTVKHYYVCD